MEAHAMATQPPEDVHDAGDAAGGLIRTLARRELVGGEVVDWSLPSYRQGFLAAALAAQIRSYAHRHGLGHVVAGVAVRILGSPRDVRWADVAFYARGRAPSDLDEPATEVAPDLVVEVLAMSDLGERVTGKVRDWLRAGVRLVWHVDPVGGATAIYQGDEVRYVEAIERLDGADVLPGFHLRLQDMRDELEGTPSA
jgi:Uma2 family endonuclease